MINTDIYIAYRCTLHPAGLGIPLCLMSIPASTLSPLFPALCQSHVAMDTTTAIQQNTSQTKKKKIHFSHLSAASLYASVSASPPASVGLCNFLSESLPACLHICLPTCSSTSASPVRPQRHIILFSREKTEETVVFMHLFLLGFYVLQYNMIPLIILVKGFIFPSV